MLMILGDGCVCVVVGFMVVMDNVQLCDWLEVAHSGCVHVHVLFLFVYFTHIYFNLNHK